jgi:large subunit ribosomal protein L22
MTVQALTKFARMSPKKVREVARLVQGKPAAEALDMLKFVPRKSARLIAKTLASAMANAEHNHNLSADSLIVHRCLVEEGPVFRRFQPVARGSAHPIRKRTSHIRIILTDEVNQPAA